MEIVLNNTLNKMIPISFILVVILINLTLIYNKTVNNLLSVILLMFASCIFFFLQLNTEFLMFAYLIIYAGAIMVMFLFVVMTIDVKSENSKATFSSDMGLSILLTNLLTAALYFFFWYGGGDTISNLRSQQKELFIIRDRLEGGPLEDAFFRIYSEGTSEEMETRFIFFDDSAIFGEYMFYKHNLIFIFSGILLLFAMVAAIIICMVFSDRKNVNKDN